MLGALNREVLGRMGVIIAVRAFLLNIFEEGVISLSTVEHARPLLNEFF